MLEDPLHQPHDKLFKTTFGDPANAAAFLREQLPPGISAAIRWDELRLESGSFVDSQFRSSESDLLFSTQLHGRECLIYLLFEHQRIFDPWIALRLLRYMLRIWEEFRRNQPQAAKLPLIVPVVLAQNSQPWELSHEFGALFDVPPELSSEARSFVPDFTFQLVQLAELPFEKIVGTPAGILVLRTLKAEQLEQLLGAEVWDESIIQRALPTFEMVLRYILSQTEIDKTAFAGRVAAIQSPDIKDIAMTLAQQFRQEGHQEGHQEGRQEGRQEGLWIGKIINLQELMGIAPVDLESLSALPVSELRLRFDELRREYDTRFRR